MLMTLFDEEQIMKNHDANLIREVTKESQINSVRSLMEKLKLSAEQAEAMLAAIRNFYDFHPVEWNYVSNLYSINPALGLQAEFQCVADATLAEYNADMAAFFEKYAEQMALYEAMMKANAQ